MEQQKEYSVFDDLTPPKAEKRLERHHQVLYFMFLGYFIILAFIRWGAFIATKNIMLTGPDTSVRIFHPPHLISAICLTAITLSSAVLFYRKSIRASIGLLIFGALLELVVFQFMRAY